MELSKEETWKALTEPYQKTCPTCKWYTHQTGRCEHESHESYGINYKCIVIASMIDDRLILEHWEKK